MDKKIYLIKKSCYRKELCENLTEKDLEEWVAEDMTNAIKIEANGYDTPEEALRGEGIFFPEDYYQFDFGFLVE